MSVDDSSTTVNNIDVATICISMRAKDNGRKVNNKGSSFNGNEMPDV